MHGMIGQLIPIAYQILQCTLSPLHLCSDDEKGGGCIVGSEDLDQFVGVLGWPIVDGEGNDLRRCRDAPEDVGPSVLEITYQKSGRFIDGVEGCDEDDEDTQSDQQGQHP